MHILHLPLFYWRTGMKKEDKKFLQSIQESNDPGELVKRLRELKNNLETELDRLEKTRKEYEKLNEELRELRNSICGSTPLQRKIMKTIYK